MWSLTEELFFKYWQAAVVQLLFSVQSPNSLLSETRHWPQSLAAPGVVLFLVLLSCGSGRPGKSLYPLLVLFLFVSVVGPSVLALPPFWLPFLHRFVRVCFRVAMNATVVQHSKIEIIIGFSHVTYIPPFLHM